MSRLIALCLLVPSLALADEPEEKIDEVQDEDEPEAIPDQSVGASAGVAGGGNVTPGGFRVSGHYLYRLAEQDWFDGTASFTFGSGGAACFRDRMDDVVCDHGFADGRERDKAVPFGHVDREGHHIRTEQRNPHQCNPPVGRGAGDDDCGLVDE
jgi:hypothetical protein